MIFDRRFMAFVIFKRERAIQLQKDAEAMVVREQERLAEAIESLK